MLRKCSSRNFAAAKDGYTFVSHQQEVGTGYFDKVTTIIQGGTSSVTALTAPPKNRSSKQLIKLMIVGRIRRSRRIRQSTPDATICASYPAILCS
ncbi:hypothetical protein QBE70_26965 [Escherichia coli]|uniref:hypothetical protein n=1 Tax=Escherichia coli TaxID=562 RepID=UPI0024340621|nr:hypothetical protein [Escherichia coli]MDG5898288.1 hypothetical protein [Escherichia coli]